MATIVFGDLENTTFTLDESAGLQNATETLGVAGDADDEDISRTDLTAAFNTLLFTTMALDPTFPDGGRIAQSTTNFLEVDGDINSISLAGVGGAALPAYDGSNWDDGGLTGLTTTAEEEIHLFSDFTDNPVAGASLTGNVVFGIDSSGDIVFAIYMKETVNISGVVELQFSMVTFEAIQHPDGGTSHDEALNLNDFLSLTVEESSGFNFAGVPPGKSMHLTAASVSGTGGVIVTPLTEVVQINTSNADPSGVIGYGSQGINAGETVVMTWVKDGLVSDFTIPNLDQNEADLAANIQFGNLDSIDEASFTIMQKVGAKVAAVKITALATNEEEGNGDGTFFDHVGNQDVGGAGDDTIVAITSVTLTRGGTEYTLTGDGAFLVGVTANFVSATDAAASGGTLFAGQVVITGVLAGDEITYQTDGDHERLLVTGVSGNVDIGGFSTSQTGTTTQPIGDAFVFEDDGPTAEITDTGEVVIHDETPGVQDGSELEDDNLPDPHDDHDQTIGSLPLIFSALGTAIGWATNANAVVTSADTDFGTDGEAATGSEAWSLNVGNGGANAVSGFVTLDGEDILLNVEDGIVVGRIDSDGDGDVTDGDLGDVVAIAIAIDQDGILSFAQYVPFAHLPDTGPDQQAFIDPDALFAVLTVTDSDGDTHVATLDIGDKVIVEDDAPAAASPDLGFVEEEHLAGGNEDTVDGPPDTGADEDTLANSNLTTNVKVTNLGSILVVQPGIDLPASFSLDGTKTNLLPALSSKGETVSYDVTGDTLTAYVNGPTAGYQAAEDREVFTWQVTAAGIATFTLLDQIDNPLNDPAAEDILSVNLTDILVVEDADNDTVTLANDFAEYSIIDDVPILTVEGTSTDADGDPATYSSGAQGDWSDNPGVDDFASLSVTFNSYEIDANGTELTTGTNSTFAQTDTEGLEYAGSVIDDFNGDLVDDTVGFTLVFNADGTYDVAVTTPPGSTTTFDTSQGSLAAGGPDPVQTLLFGGSAGGSDDIVFFGVVPTAPTSGQAGGDALADPPQTPNDIRDLVYLGATDLTEAQIQASFPIPNLINSATQMNVSTSGIGINNNNLDGNGTAGLQSNDESFVVNPETVVDNVTVFIDNSVGGYNPVTEDLYYTVYYTNGDVSGQILVTADDLDPVTTGVAAGGVQFTIEDTVGDKQIDAVQLTMELGKIKIPVISFTVETDFSPESLDLDFTAEMFDGDGDSASDDFSVQFDPDPSV